jgi:hypothetical protein
MAVTWQQNNDPDGTTPLSRNPDAAHQLADSEMRGCL